jgi:hypothetical protein
MKNFPPYTIAYFHDFFHGAAIAQRHGEIVPMESQLFEKQMRLNEIMVDMDELWMSE